MRFYVLQHVVFETPGLLKGWMLEKGGEVRTVCLWEEAMPFLEDFDALIVLGGPMSVHDEGVFPWLRAEKALISSAIKAGKKVLGICLGAQLIAEVMGGRVYPNPVKEIGFWPLVWTEEAKRMFPGLGDGIGSGDGGLPFHWHGETFDLPPGAILLASSAGCVNQGFKVGENVMGLQFHPEVTEEIVEAMIRHEGHELEEEGPFIQGAEEIRGQVAANEDGARSEAVGAAGLGREELGLREARLNSLFNLFFTVK